MAYRYGDDRKQTMLFPESIDQYVKDEHPVRAYDAFVDALDFAELGIPLDERKVGNSTYDPRLMLKLLLYGYSYGVKSSRKLERELHNNLSFIWLMKNLKPDHKTISEFRRHHKGALAKALKLCARLCLKLGLIQGNILFVDSTKIWANAGKAHQHNEKWYQKKLVEVDKRIARLLTECEKIDQDEAHLGSLVEMPKELKTQQQLKTSIEAALAEFAHQSERTKDGKERQINRSDPESRQMKSPRGSHPSYAVHSVVDDQNGLIVHMDTVNDANDSGQLAGQINGAEDNLDQTCQIACADAGYANIDEIEKVDSDERTVLVPSQRQAADKAPEPFDKCQFVYDPEQDCYYCPAGQKLCSAASRTKPNANVITALPNLSSAKVAFTLASAPNQSRGAPSSATSWKSLKRRLRRAWSSRRCSPFTGIARRGSSIPLGTSKRCWAFGSSRCEAAAGLRRRLRLWRSALI